MSLKRKRSYSKNKKKNWRKTDIDDVEEYLEEVRMQQRTGGLAAEKKDEQLFFVDKVTESSGDVEEKSRKKKREAKPLKCYSVLEPDPHIKPAKISHNVPKEINILRRKSVRVLLSNEQKRKSQLKETFNEDKTRSKIARNKLKREKNIAKYDLWNMESDQNTEDIHYLRCTKQAKVKAPKHFHEKTSEIPAIEKPHPGQSFNPTYTDHQDLLRTAHNTEVKKIQEDKKLKRSLDDKFPSLADAPTEKTWLSEMSGGLWNSSDSEAEAEHSDLTRLSINPPVRRENKKTEKQRRKEKEAKNKVKEIQAKRLAKFKENELTSHLKSIKKEVNKQEIQLKKRFFAKQLKKMKDQNKPKKLGKIKYTEPDVPLKLSEELVGSLRHLKPEGDLLLDRFKSLQKRNMIEPRQRVKRMKPRKVKYAEKKGHKEITL